jgi:DMSO/TMAO reductase YedYZ molybdopterin-dependent catalytic subunit
MSDWKEQQPELPELPRLSRDHALLHHDDPMHPASRDQALDAVRVFHAEHGRLPRWHEWERATASRPCAKTIERWWGWRELLAEAIGTQPNQVDVSWGTLLDGRDRDARAAPGCGTVPTAIAIPWPPKVQDDASRAVRGPMICRGRRDAPTGAPERGVTLPTSGTAMSFVSRGFRGRRPEGAEGGRLPPGQYLTKGFPVLSAGPTPRTPHAEWSFSISGEVDQPRRWTWDEFRALPAETVTKDIHCVTKWSKFDTVWTGVPVDALLDGVETAAEYVMAYSDGGYTTNLPLEDVMGGRAWVAYQYDGQPLEPQHGGPARLLVPHLYLWKSAKWVRGLRLMAEDAPGFWETYGYHMYGDPWREQRYSGD